MLSITMATNDITAGFNLHKTQLLRVSICWHRSFEDFWGYEYVSTTVLSRVCYVCLLSFETFIPFVVNVVLMKET